LRNRASEQFACLRLIESAWSLELGAMPGSRTCADRKATLEEERVNYRITQINSWIVVNPSGKAQDNEPLRVEHLFHKWLTMEKIRVIINLKELARFGVCEIGLLAAFRREVHRRNGVLRLCNLNPKLNGYFRQEGFLELFELYVDLEGAMQKGGIPTVRVSAASQEAVWRPLTWRQGCHCSASVRHDRL
jgi:anti-anti-sigma factor